jgi:ATP-dependent DNA ligase
MEESLATRWRLLGTPILPKLRDPVREAPRFDVKFSDLVNAVRAQGLEGIVAKRLDSAYEPEARSGAWQKMRINRGQEFVIGGYTKGGRSLDALVFGYYDGDRLIYAARTRNGFTPASRDRLMKRLKQLEIPKCPFANLPEARAGRWGQGLTAEKMNDCVWLTPTLVGHFEFVEWTPDNHLRHSRFVNLRDDKKARDVHRVD